jgi:2-C-methyl-D-erythritol 2,4-cyclodiphosphate synthase
LQKVTDPVKVGIGQDSHRFEKTRSRKPCVLGGVKIPGCQGLLGNSDADVVLHALTNAVSGISGVNVLGTMTDRMCLEKGITDSREYLKKALATLKGYRISHVSVSVEGKKPKLAAHIPSIKKSLARLMSLTVADIGFTSTSGEDLTAFGRGEGLQVFVIVTAKKRPHSGTR